MAASQILTIADRAIVAAVLRLSEITTANGYNFDVAKVRRRAQPTWGHDTPEIALFFGHISEARRTGREDRVYETQAVQIRFACDGIDEETAPPDRPGRYMIGDIRRCLNEKQRIPGSTPPRFRSRPIADPFYPKGFIRALCSGARIFQATDPRRVSGVLFYELSYWSLAAEPCLWDVEDVFIREEQLADIGIDL